MASFYAVGGEDVDLMYAVCGALRSKGNGISITIAGAESVDGMERADIILVGGVGEGVLSLVPRHLRGKTIVCDLAHVRRPRLYLTLLEKGFLAVSPGGQKEGFVERVLATIDKVLEELAGDGAIVGE
jgi:hypothetical protein